MERRVESDERQRRLQQPQDPGQPIRPPNLVLEFSEYEMRIVLIRRREEHDANDDNGEDRPVQGRVVPAAQDLVAPDIGARREGEDGQENEVCRPLLDFVPPI